MRGYLWSLVPRGGAVAAWSGLYGKSDDIIHPAEDQGLIGEFIQSSPFQHFVATTDHSVASQWSRMLRTNYR